MSYNGTTYRHQTNPFEDTLVADLSYYSQRFNSRIVALVNGRNEPLFRDQNVSPPVQNRPDRSQPDNAYFDAVPQTRVPSFPPVEDLVNPRKLETFLAAKSVSNNQAHSTKAQVYSHSRQEEVNTQLACSEWDNSSPPSSQDSTGQSSTHQPQYSQNYHDGSWRYAQAEFDDSDTQFNEPGRKRRRLEGFMEQQRISGHYEMHGF